MATKSITKNSARTRWSARKAGFNVDRVSRDTVDRPSLPIVEQEQPDIM